MDKVKVVLAVLKKYHFWVLCLLVVIFAAMIWTAASADLQKQFDQRKNKLESALKSARSIAGETGHPNGKTNQALTDVNSLQRQKVLESWTALYEKQQKENPWPSVLGEQFIEHVKSRKPDEEIKIQYRALYQRFIRDYLPALFEIVDYRHTEQIEDGDENQAAMGGQLGARVMQPGMMDMGIGGKGYQQNFQIVGIVDWDETDRERIKQSLWWHGAPTTVQLRMAQEDIWVYQALLHIIKSTNEGATSYYNAAVKKIAALEIGKAAAGEVSSGGPDLASAVLGGGLGARGMGGGGGMGAPGMGGGMPMGGGGGMGAPGMGGGMPMGGGGGMGAPGMDAGGGMGMGGGMGGAAMPSQDQEVLDYRYVDQNKMPLTSTASPPFAEFKMMPIRMSLLMDQRKIPKLLAECANSTMPVEVQRIRINPSEGLGSKSGMTVMSRGSSGGMGGGMPMGGEMGMGMSGMGRGLGGFSAKNNQAAEVNLNEVPVEIVGIIYIYNPPDLAKVGTGTAQETDQAMPAAPVDASAAPGLSGAVAPPSGTDMPPAAPVGEAPSEAVPGATQPGIMPDAQPGGPPGTRPEAAPPGAMPATPPAAAPATPQGL